MKAEALPKISIMALKLKVNFTKQTMSRGVLDLLSNGLEDDPEKDVLLLSLKDCLVKMAKGNKLQYKAANYLLTNILNALTLEDGDGSDEIILGSTAATQSEDSPLEDLDLDDTVQGSTDGASGNGSAAIPVKPSKTDNTDKLDKSDKAEKSDKSGRSDKSDKKKKEICRFYNNGKCRFNTDCRFQHPKICPKFRQHGDCKSKGCSGNCDFLHPNVCRNSLKDRTCFYPECRFFHLKGTKTVERGSKSNNASDPNWRSDNQNQNVLGSSRTGPGSQRKGTNQTQAKTASKNRQAGLNQRTKKKVPNPSQNQKQATPPVEAVTQEEKKQLGQTLEAIMKRLDAMESRTSYYPHPGVQLQPQIQPLLSPAVPQPGTHTQYQWGSQPPWTQTQQ